MFFLVNGLNGQSSVVRYVGGCFFFWLLLLVDTFRRHEERNWMMDSGEFQVDELVGVRPRFCST